MTTRPAAERTPAASATSGTFLRGPSLMNGPAKDKKNHETGLLDTLWDYLMGLISDKAELFLCLIEVSVEKLREE